MPSRDIKPITSVIVVRITPPASAGSIFNFVKIKGRLTPLIAPIIKLIIKAAAIIKPRSILPNHKYVKNATTEDYKIPLRRPMADSFIIKDLEFE